MRDELKLCEILPDIKVIDPLYEENMTFVNGLASGPFGFLGS